MFVQMAEQGLADISLNKENKSEKGKSLLQFQWRPAGLSFLNERIWEMHSALAAKPKSILLAIVITGQLVIDTSLSSPILQL